MLKLQQKTEGSITNINSLIESNFKILSAKVEDLHNSTRFQLDRQEELLKKTYMKRKETIKYVGN